MWAVIIVGLLNIFRTPIFNSFSRDPKLLEVIDQIWFLLNIYVTFDIL